MIIRTKLKKTFNLCRDFEHYQRTLAFKITRNILHNVAFKEIVFKFIKK